MTWSIYAAGSPDHVKKQTEEANVYGQAGGVAAKELITAVCGAIPQEHRDTMEVNVKASGHSDVNHHSVSIVLLLNARCRSTRQERSRDSYLKT
jgi:hypothetical protein